MRDDCKENFIDLFRRIESLENRLENIITGEQSKILLEKLEKFESDLNYIKAWTQLHDDHHFKFGTQTNKEEKVIPLSEDMREAVNNYLKENYIENGVLKIQPIKLFPEQYKNDNISIKSQGGTIDSRESEKANTEKPEL